MPLRMDHYGWDAFCGTASWCAWNSVIMTASSISIISLSVLLARIAWHCDKAKSASPGQDRQANAIGKVIARAVVMVCIIDLLFHAVDIPFVLDDEAPPIYVAMESKHLTKDFIISVVYHVIMDGFGLATLWGHFNLAWVTYSWVVNKTVATMEIRTHLGVFFLIMFATVIRLILVGTAGPTGLAISVIAFNGVIVPVAIILTVQYFVLTVRALQGAATGSSGSLSVDSSENIDGRSGGRDEGKAEYYIIHDKSASLSTDTDSRRSDYARSATRSVAPGSYDTETIRAPSTTSLCPTTSYHALIVQLLRVTITVVIMWFIGAMSSLTMYLWWLDRREQPDLSVFVLYMFATRLMGFTDALLLGGFCMKSEVKRQLTCAARRQKRRKTNYLPTAPSFFIANIERAISPPASDDINAGRDVEKGRTSS